MTRIEISKKWRRDTDNGPDCCLSCPDYLNGINYGWIKISNLKVHINLCDKCLRKLKQKIKEK